MGTAKRKWLRLFCLQYMAPGIGYREIDVVLPLLQFSFRNGAANSQPTNRPLSAFSNGPAATLRQTSMTPIPSTLKDGLITPHPTSPPIVRRQCNLSVSVPEIALAKSKPTFISLSSFVLYNDITYFLRSLSSPPALCMLRDRQHTTPLASSSLATVHGQ